MTTSWYSVVGSSDCFVQSDRGCYVPGMTCTACEQTWVTFGAVYPSVDCGLLPPELRRAPGTSGVDENRALRAALLRHFGDDRVLYPASEFGTPSAPLQRKPPQVFRELFGLFVAPEVAADPAFQTLGVTAVPFTARSKRGGKTFELVELEAWPVARRAVTRAPSEPPCAVCGFPASEPYEDEPLLASSLAGRHIAREVDTPAFLFVSAALRAVFAKFKGAEELELVPVKVV